MGKIIIAPHREEMVGPLVYLAGPIYGAPDWHSDAIGMLGMNSELHIATLRRAIEMNTEFSPTQLQDQMKWADHFIRHALHNGIVMFWFPKPIAVIEQGGYGHTSRIELGATIEYLKNISTAHVVIGIQEGFVDEMRMKTLLSYHTPHILVETSLHDVCEKVLLLSNTLS